METIKSASSDGCINNTGPYKGAIRLLEELLNRPLHWLICMLHLVELVFRHLFIKIDGKLDGPNKYSGEIGAQISGKDGLKRTEMNTEFKPFPNAKVPIIEECFLNNNDVKKLYLLCLLIMNGFENATEEQINAFNGPPGKVTAARWITTAVNILCLYLQSKSPTPNLVLLTSIILNLYCPALFKIKQEWEFYHAPKHFYEILKLSKSLFSKRPELLEVVHDVLRNNCYSIHPENVVTCMVMDGDEKVNQEGLKIIKAIRKKKAPIRVRRFAKPKEINFEAKSYVDIVDFANYSPKNFASPPLLNGLSLDDIRDKKFPKDLCKIPCHSQHVERYVYLTTQASQSVAGQEARHASIINKQQAPSFLTKAACKNVADAINKE